MKTQLMPEITWCKVVSETLKLYYQSYPITVWTFSVGNHQTLGDGKPLHFFKTVDLKAPLGIMCTGRGAKVWFELGFGFKKNC